MNIVHMKLSTTIKLIIQTSFKSTLKINLQTILAAIIGTAIVVCGENTLKSQGLDMLWLAGTHISAELNLQDNVEIYQTGNSIKLQITGNLAYSRNFPPIRSNASQKITKNLIIHIGVYPLVSPSGSAIQPEIKHVDTAKSQAEYENEFPITISSESPYNFPITFLAPKNEGVYEIVVSIYSQSQTPLPRSFSKPDVELVKQIVIVNPESKQRQQNQQHQNQQQRQRQNNQLADTFNSIDKELIEQNNPQKNEWWKPNLKRLPAIPTPKLPNFIDRNPATNITPPDNFRFAANKKSLAQFFELYVNPSANLAENNNSSKSENNSNIVLHPSNSLESKHSWHVISLNLNEIGKPHLIEIDYPSSAPQKLEIAVVETVDNEHVVSAESCIIVTENIGQVIASADSSAQSSNTHRILFWSKTKSPTLLFVNRSGQDCFFGNVKLYKIKSESIQRPYKIVPKRLAAGYLNRPETLLQLASTIEKSDSKSNANFSDSPKILARDWQPLYESANRLVETLHWNGFDGLMLNVSSRDA
ncbi:MAG: hypothetical protein LBB88_10430, partial [Planctomycetaceae bacterium]|nr:hypothetical protein [Planctomycetaceae bacterium]